MFTGIVTHLGKVLENANGKVSIELLDETFCQTLSLGESISCNGICLTVINFTQNSFKVDYVPETGDKTTVGTWQPGDQINLEKSATVSTLLAGHIVQGHVDGMGEVIKIEQTGNSWVIEIQADYEIIKFLAYKGSIALNGISLTLKEVLETSFEIAIIPHTWEKTTMSDLVLGDKVNLEVDVLAKYVHQQLQNLNLRK